MTLLVMAAGMGSRYGGLKQLDPVGPNGEFILDYTVYDALQAGFDNVVFIIKEENLEIFKETVGKGDTEAIQRIDCDICKSGIDSTNNCAKRYSNAQKERNKEYEESL